MRRDGGGCGVSANEYSCTHGAQINFRDLTPYLTFGYNVLLVHAYICARSLFLGQEYRFRTPYGIGKDGGEGEWVNHFRPLYPLPPPTPLL
jgi:hypothetical protein